jgi:hypothetical protein
MIPVRSAPADREPASILHGSEVGPCCSTEQRLEKQRPALAGQPAQVLCMAVGTVVETPPGRMDVPVATNPKERPSVPNATRSNPRGQPAAGESPRAANPEPPPHQAARPWKLHLPATAVDHNSWLGKLSPRLFTLMIKLEPLCRDRAYCSFSNAFLCRFFNLKERALQALLRDGEKAGLIHRRTSEFGETVRYALFLLKRADENLPVVSLEKDRDFIAQVVTELRRKSASRKAQKSAPHGAQKGVEKGAQKSAPRPKDVVVETHANRNYGPELGPPQRQRPASPESSPAPAAVLLALPAPARALAALPAPAPAATPAVEAAAVAELPAIAPPMAPPAAPAGFRAALGGLFAPPAAASQRPPQTAARPAPAPAVESPAPPATMPLSPPALTPTQRQWLDGLGREQRQRFAALPATAQARLLEPHRDLVNPDRILAAEAARILAPPAPAAAPPPLPATAAELWEQLPHGPADWVHHAVNYLVRELGEKEAQFRPAFQQLALRVWRGEVEAWKVVDSIRQAKGEKAKAPGKVFTTALKNHGITWRGSRP